MYIKRTIGQKLMMLLEHFPAVAILGPRQAGKTTLVKEIRKQLNKESIYLDLENPADSGALDHPVEFLNALTDKTVIIDEIQRRPELFPILRSVIDSNRVNARFILLGSASPELLFLSNETLAGRIVYLELTPFEHTEIQQLSDFRNHWLKGGFPDPFLMDDQHIRKEWFKSFISAYIERDLRLLGLSASPANLQRLLQMISATQGGMLNSSSLSNSLGISSPSVSNAISFFERSFIVRLLQPWHSNIGKRTVKSPKIYIRDSGIVNYLLNISDYENLLRHPLLGNLWEGYVIEDIINTLGDEYNYFFYRTADGTECDLLIFRGEDCLAVIDAKFTPNPQRTKSMTITIQDLNPNKSFFVVPECPSPYKITDNLIVATPWQLTEIIRSI
ncbi:MAG: ATP-binding protein [Bacteroidota bacterium]|nr:ATPase [Odoribacter sp.]MDP3642289.1 ATP-binding protein [Bacteroidota bacterium]